MRWPATVIIVGLLLSLALPSAANADSWAPATKVAVESSDRQHRFTMTPRELSSNLAYFEDAVAGKPKPGQREGQNTSARGRLEVRTAVGRWATVWDKPLVNDVAPVDVVVAPSGRVVATLDNWHFVGRGDNVLVFYGPDGTMIRSLKLSDLLPDFYIKALPSSVSSTRWRSDVRFGADGRLIIPIVRPADDWSDDSKTVDVVVDPAGGGISPVDPAKWSAALDAARRVAAAKDEAERKSRDAFIAPLLGPTTIGEREWHQYLSEAFFRLDPDWKDNSANTSILRSPQAADYKTSVGWLRETLLETDMEADRVMIASPSSPDNLIVELHKIVRDLRPRQLKAATLYIAAPPSHRDRLLALLAPSGAKLIYVDPSVPIPQRADRLAQSRYADDK